MDIKAYVTKHEGERLYAYKDSLGIWTIGVGFNIEREGARAAMKAAGVNPDVVWAAIEEAKKAGQARTAEVITKTKSQKLLEADLQACYADLRTLFADFDAFPEPARAVLVDMRFQLGPTRLRAFKNTLYAFSQRRWKDAAAGIKGSLMYKQVKRRCDENIALLNSI